MEQQPVPHLGNPHPSQDFPFAGVTSLPSPGPYSKPWRPRGQRPGGEQMKIRFAVRALGDVGAWRAMLSEAGAGVKIRFEVVYLVGAGWVWG